MPTVTVDTLTDLLATATAHLPAGDLCAPHKVERSLLTGGPTVSVTHLHTGRTMAVGYEPATRTWRVWDHGSSVTTPSADRVPEHLAHFAGYLDDDPARWTVQP